MVGRGSRRSHALLAAPPRYFWSSLAPLLALAAAATKVDVAAGREAAQRAAAEGTAAAAAAEGTAAEGAAERGCDGRRRCARHRGERAQGAATRRRCWCGGEGARGAQGAEGVGRPCRAGRRSRRCCTSRPLAPLARPRSPGPATAGAAAAAVAATHLLLQVAVGMPPQRKLAVPASAACGARDACAVRRGFAAAAINIPASLHFHAMRLCASPCRSGIAVAPAWPPPVHRPPRLRCVRRCQLPACHVTGWRARHSRLLQVLIRRVPRDA